MSHHPSEHRRSLGLRICADLDRMETAAPVPTFDYFVVMVDHGKRGFEAVVDPEITRREIVSRILTFEYDPEAIQFIHHVSSLGVEDVTLDIMTECARQSLGDAPDDGSYTDDPRLGVRISKADRQANAFDHARKLRMEA